MKTPIPLKFQKVPNHPITPSPRHIVVARFDHLGDNILGLPLIYSLRQTWPEARIDLVVNPVAANLMHGQPICDRVLSFDTSAFGPSMLSYLDLSKFSTRHWSDSTVDLYISPRSDSFDSIHVALLSLMLQPRISVCSQRYLEFPGPGTVHRPHLLHRSVRRIAFNRVIHSNISNVHELDRLDEIREAFALAPMKPPILIIGAHQRSVARSWLEDLSIKNGHGLIALAPGARDPRRQWGLDRFGELIRVLAEQHPEIQFLLLGSPDEFAALASCAAQFAPGLVLVPRIELYALPALLAACDWFIGNDSGPAHIASAVGCPVTVISCHPIGGNPLHQNAPERFSPAGDFATVVRPKPTSFLCLHNCTAADYACCIRNIQATDVAATVKLNQL